MKVLLLMMVTAASMYFFKPDLLSEFPIPKDQAWEQRQIDGYAKRCLKNIDAKIRTQITDHYGLKSTEFKNLTLNPTFRESYCGCQGEIVRYNNLVPSNYLPRSYQIRQLRGIASKMVRHLKTSDGQEQLDYCFKQAWNKAAFSK